MIAGISTAKFVCCSVVEQTEESKNECFEWNLQAFESLLEIGAAAGGLEENWSTAARSPNTASFPPPEGNFPAAAAAEAIPTTKLDADNELLRP